MGGQAKVDPQVALRKIAASAANLILLDKVTSRGPEARVQGERTSFCRLQFEADPMIARASLVAQNHRFALQVLDYYIQVAVIEQVTHGQAAAYLRDLYGRTGKLAYVAKGAVVLIEV
jgi:hypothetical protein